jgi:hypothetical protein
VAGERHWALSASVNCCVSFGRPSSLPQKVVKCFCVQNRKEASQNVFAYKIEKKRQIMFLRTKSKRSVTECFAYKIEKYLNEWKNAN